VSTLIYSVRDVDKAPDTPSGRERGKIDWIIFLVVIAVGPGVFLVNRLIDTVAWRSFLTEGLSLCLYAAVAVWYAMRRQPKRAWRLALAVYIAGLLIMGLVHIAAKRGLSVPLVESERASEPRLLIGVLMLLFLPLLGSVARWYPIEMSRIGFSFPNSQRRLFLFISAGLGVGVLIGLHFWLTARVAGMNLEVKPWPYMAWQVFYELGPESLTEELFMRGVIFNELFFGREWGFLSAALATSSLELLSALARQDYALDFLVVVGVVFYTIVGGVASAGLFRWSRSVIPGYANKFVLGMITVLR
jgi:hypothetical protein